MSAGRTRPERIFVRGFGTSEGIEWGFWLVLMVFWIVELDLGPVELMLLGIVLEGSVILAETPTGVVADLKSRKRSLIIAQVLMGVSFLWSVASLNFWVILPGQALLGVGWTFRSGADTAWVTDELKGSGEFDDDDVDQLLLQRNRFAILVSLVTVPITILIGVMTSVRWAGVAMGLLYLLMAGWFYLVMTEEHFTPGEETGRGFVQTLTEGVAVVRGRPRLRVLVAVILLVEFGAEGFDRLGFKHFLDNATASGLSENQESIAVLGVLFMVLALSALVVNAVASRALTSGKGVVRVAVALIAVAAVGGMIAAVTNAVIVIAIGVMMQDSVREALWPVMEGWANRDAPSEVRATVHSLMGQSTSIGEVAGAIVLGGVAELVSIQAALVVGAVFFVAAGLSSIRAIER